MSFLIPIGVVVYAAIGGLKATFTTSYLHTVIVFCLCLIFMFSVYVPGGFLNGIDDVSPTSPPPFPRVSTNETACLTSCICSWWTSGGPAKDQLSPGALRMRACWRTLSAER